MIEAISDIRFIVYCLRRWLISTISIKSREAQSFCRYYHWIWRSSPVTLRWSEWHIVFCTEDHTGRSKASKWSRIIDSYTDIIYGSRQSRSRGWCRMCIGRREVDDASDDERGRRYDTRRIPRIKCKWSFPQRIGNISTHSECIRIGNPRKWEWIRETSRCDRSETIGYTWTRKRDQSCIWITEMVIIEWCLYQGTVWEYARKSISIVLHILQRIDLYRTDRVSIIHSDASLSNFISITISKLEGESIAIDSIGYHRSRSLHGTYTHRTQYGTIWTEQWATIGSTKILSHRRSSSREHWGRKSCYHFEIIDDSSPPIRISNLDTIRTRMREICRST